eukprot:CCRYP_008879-RD/>CCRYP_008879-RD protein AED:0.46 eAED:1.00 QI:0/-1/0/1/-1/0/1/0/11
MLLKEAPCIGG